MYYCHECDKEYETVPSKDDIPQDIQCKKNSAYQYVIKKNKKSQDFVWETAFEMYLGNPYIGRKF